MNSQNQLHYTNFDPIAGLLKMYGGINDIPQSELDAFGLTKVTDRFGGVTLMRKKDLGDYMESIKDKQHDIVNQEERLKGEMWADEEIYYGKY